MAMFCCCRGPPLDEDSDDEGVGRHQHQILIPLPTLPPPARLADNCHIADCLAPIQRLETAASLRSGGAMSSTLSSFPNHGHIYLGQLVLEESDADGDIDSPVAKRHGGPLDAVRSKFSRNRLHASSARSSRTSVGTSDEELARRAELKRLMHRRIQEELENEETPTNERSASVLSAAKSVTPAPPGSGPRDTLEFSMVDTSLPDDVRSEKHANLKTSRSLNVISQLSDKVVPTKQLSHASSLREERVLVPPAEYTEILAHINISDPPATPLLQPTKEPPAPEDMSPSSLMLSPETSRCRHAEAPPEDSPRPKESTPRLIRDCSSGFGNWLLVQGLCNSGGSKKKRLGPREAKAPVDNDEQPEAKQESCHVLDLDLPGVTLFDEISPPDEDTPNAVPGEKEAAGREWDDTQSAVNQESSSVYPSAPTTRRHTPRASGANSEVNMVHTRSFHGLQLSTFGRTAQGLVTSRSGVLPGRAANNANNASSQSLVIPASEYPHRTTLELPSSIAVSETSSYHRREAELEAVEKRFADVVARRVTKEPKSSKFKEEFDLPVHPGIVTRSSMLLQKLHLPVPNFSRPRSRSSGQPPTMVYYHQDHTQVQGEASGGNHLTDRKSVEVAYVSHTPSPV